jgi:CTP synthase
VSVHVTLVPWIGAAGELKTKPTQHSVKEMREIGIQPDVLLCRTDRPLSQSIKEKISLFSNVPTDFVISALDVSCLYELPRRCTPSASTTSSASGSTSGRACPTWPGGSASSSASCGPPRAPARIAVVGKYVHLRDSYKSLHEALVHGGIANDCRVELDYVDSEQLERPARRGLPSARRLRRHPRARRLRRARHRGQDLAIRYAREKGIPFFGICLGMQLAVVEFARHVAGIPGPTAPSSTPQSPSVIDLMPEQRAVRDKGATMRLGAYPCTLPRARPRRPGLRRDGDLRAPPAPLRGQQRLPRGVLTAKGLVLSGTSPDKKLVEMIELGGAPVLRGLPVSPRAEVAPDGAAPALRALRARGRPPRCTERRSTEDSAALLEAAVDHALDGAAHPRWRCTAPRRR